MLSQKPWYSVGDFVPTALYSQPPVLKWYHMSVKASQILVNLFV